MQPLIMETEDEVLVRWDLTADSVTSLNYAEILEAVGNVFLKRGNEYLKADFARYYLNSKWVYLKGNVVVQSGNDEIKAEEAEFDLRSHTGWLKQGRIFMSGPHAYISGERIDKHWGDVYSFRQAKVTTCDGDAPAWSFTAEEAVVEIDGYARLTRSTFQVNETAVAYSP
jgi:LPS-assembly protein